MESPNYDTRAHIATEHDGHVRDKAEFYSLYNRKLLGNMLRNWTHAEWSALHKRGTYPVDVIAARCTSRASAPMRYDLKPADALQWVHDTAKAQGIDPTAYQLSELAPDHTNTLQAELMRDEKYMYLRYTLFSHKRMRDCINDSHHVSGLKALGLLKAYMDAPSYDYTMDLLDRYPDSVIEFCCYERAVGLFGWNTLFWEVRDY